ncbi:hypothetical protein ABZ896_51725, partial [Streptomyces sp. NPDC047072]
MTFWGDFTYETRPVRVVFRPGAAVTATPGEAEQLGLRRLLVVCGGRGEAVARRVADALGDACAYPALAAKSKSAWSIPSSAI